MGNENTDIEKLTERIAKDPKSKLFVPLAEEHKKTGDIETAIRILTEGLKHNPTYVTARSFLGRLLLDKGDLAGAQKELEEVIKTIPDNLLAQRKLGDIYVLQGRGTDALPRYKTAFALNPGDKDLPSLLADLEAGRDVSSRIPKPKSLISPAEKTAPPAPAATVQPKAAPVAAIKTAAPPAAAQKTPAASGSPSAMKGGQASTVPAPPERAATEASPVPPAPDEAEVIEDIVELESLDQAAPGPEAKSLSPDIFPAPVAFDMSEPLIEKASAGEENEAVSWAAAETAVPEQSVQAGPDESSDDLNTNTLAELYISQGFYDKAIEVYQGMLNDRPGNTALMHKLEQIRSMAGAADKGSGRSTVATRGPGEYTLPATDVFNAVPTQTKTAFESSKSATDASSQNEAMPRDRVPQMTVHEPSGEPAASQGPQAATTRRKETIDRLESWLNTIMKEKQE